MFRVSPWITYDPAPEARQEGLTRTNNHFYNMPDDVEMDAPQIDTLREEETPEPQPTTPARTSKFRVKLLVNETKTKKAPASSSRKQTAQNADSEDDDDDDDEEDQLIDDDEEETKTAVPSVVPSPEKRGTAAKRGTTTTGRGRGRGGGRRGRGQGRGGALSAGAAASAAATDLTGAASSSAPVVQKRGRGRGGSTRGRKRAPKTSILIPSHVIQDTNSLISESAASSPIGHDEHSPEPMDFLSHAQSTISIAPAPSASSISASLPTSVPEEIDLEGIPLPLYPLPSKPPAVQPPQKIGSGFAPVVPLDKTGKKVRHWRQAHREVRGIAGGRWFARSWIGEKESEYASAAASASSALQSGAAVDRENLSALTTGSGLPLPKLPGGTLLTRGPGRPRIHPKVEASLATNPSSRAQSIASDSLPPAVATKGLKRTHTQMSSAAETPTVLTPAP